ncbi:hypothetical protein FPV67DRAFT_169884 [Lyophyllum atratum]|nr:hypothetical protein FPV67DRAFT_169884 [Lyophyllum atratum]
MDPLSAIVRVVFAVAVCVSFHITYTPPGKAAPHEQAPTKGAGEKVLKFNRAIIKAIKGTYWAVGAAEVLAIAVGQMPSTHITRRILHTLIRSGDIDDLYLTPVTLVALALIISGSWIRWKCYRTMESLFTFELSIRENHRLVTNGPYSVVRHPSYTGLVAVHVGMYIWYGSGGSWLWESGLLQTVGGIVAAFIFTAISMAGLAGTLRRVPTEDGELRKLFTTEWEQWADRVPYALFPGIY